MLSLLIASALAAEIRVGPNEGRTNLGFAIVEANEGDTIILAADYTPDIRGLLIDIPDLTIVGEGAEPVPAPPMRVVETGALLQNLKFTSAAEGFAGSQASFIYIDESYGLVVVDGAEARVEQSRFEGVAGTAPVYVLDATLELAEVEFTGSETSSAGSLGHIVALQVSGEEDDYGRLSLDQVTMKENGEMGGVRVQADGGRADLSVTAGEFVDLSAPQGAVVAAYLSAGAGTVELEGALLQDSRSQEGAVFVKGGELKVDNLTVEGSDGGVFRLQSASMDMQNSMLLGGSRDAGGSVLAMSGSVGEIRKSFVCGYTSQTGGDLQVESSSNLLVQNSALMGNSGPSTLKADDSQLKLENVSFVDNSQVAITADQVGDLSIVNTLVQGSDLGLSVGAGTSIDRVAYSLFWDNRSDASSEDVLQMAGILRDEEPLYEDPGFSAAACDPPIQAPDSPVVDAGDPNLEDPWGGRSDIGMYGGPGSEDIGLEPRPPDSGDSGDSVGDSGPDPGELARSWHSGGSCGEGASSGPAAGLGLGLLGLLLLRRRR